MKLLVTQASSVTSFHEPRSLETSLRSQAPALDTGSLRESCFSAAPSVSWVLPEPSLWSSSPGARGPSQSPGHIPPSLRLCGSPTPTQRVLLPALGAAAETGRVWSLESGHSHGPIGILPSRSADSCFGRMLVLNLSLQTPAHQGAPSRTVLPRDHPAPLSITQGWGAPCPGVSAGGCGKAMGAPGVQSSKGQGIEARG